MKILRLQAGWRMRVGMPELLGILRGWVKVDVIVGHLFPDFCINDTCRFNRLSRGELGVLFYSSSVATDFSESTQCYQQLRPPLFWLHIIGGLVPDVFGGNVDC